MPSIPHLRRTAGELSRHVSNTVELYERTYTTLLRSSGETRLRVLEASHRAMAPSLHAGADAPEPDLGAFLYAVHRLPAGVWQARLVAVGQDAGTFRRAGLGSPETWRTVAARARRRRWHDDGDGMLAVMIASTSDLDDLIPTLVAYQIEWNKLHRLVSAADPSDAVDAEWCAEAIGGAASDWQRLSAAWDGGVGGFLRAVSTHDLDLRLRMLGGSEAGYSRITRRWWTPIAVSLREQGLAERRLYFVSSNTHSLVNLITDSARRNEHEIIDWIEQHGPADLRAELASLKQGRSKGSWDNFLYYCARLFYQAQTEGGSAWLERRDRERKLGVTHIPSTTAVTVSAQIIDPARLDVSALDPRLRDVSAQALRESDAVIVNINYPLGNGAYNILREIAQASGTLRGVYVLGKAATLNAQIGDVMISNVVHDEHSGSTYWLNNAFTVDDIQPFLLFGSGLDNQRAVTVKGTFLQNHEYLDFYYREAFTVVEMEAGPFCNAVYEIADADRYPVGESVNFSKLPIDFGVIHYASDTPYTQARTLGARGLSYYGMDSTYAASVAIMRRIFKMIGAL